MDEFEGSTTAESVAETFEPKAVDRPEIQYEELEALEELEELGELEGYAETSVVATFEPKAVDETRLGPQFDAGASAIATDRV